MKIHVVHELAAQLPELWRQLLQTDLCSCTGDAVLRSSRTCQEADLGVRIAGIDYPLRGHVRRVRVDEAGHRLVLVARAADPVGRNHADATIDVRLMPGPAGTRAELDVDLRLVGRIAYTGEADIVAAVDGLVAATADHLVARVRELPAAAAFDGARAAEASREWPVRLVAAAAVVMALAAMDRTRR